MLTNLAQLNRHKPHRCGPRQLRRIASGDTDACLHRMKGLGHARADAPKTEAQHAHAEQRLVGVFDRNFDRAFGGRDRMKDAELIVCAVTHDLDRRALAQASSCGVLQ